MFEIEMSKLSRLVGRMQNLQEQVRELLIALHEQNEIFDPDANVSSIAFEELVVNDNSLYRNTDGQLQMVAKGRSTSVRYDIDSKKVLNRVPYFVGIRDGQCEKVYVLLDEDESGRCDVLSYSYAD